jgi:hypothetical protein
MPPPLPPAPRMPFIYPHESKGAKGHPDPSASPPDSPKSLPNPSPPPIIQASKFWSGGMLEAFESAAPGLPGGTAC